MSNSNNCICYLCSTTFKRPYNLSVHLREKRCKSSLIEDLEELNSYLKDLNNLLEKNNKIEEENDVLEKEIPDNNHVGELLNKHKKRNVKVNPITKLNLSHNKMNNITLLEKFDESSRNETCLNALLFDYIKNIICNKEIPENMCITYTEKRRPKFNVVIDDSGNDNIRTLQDICDMYSSIFLKILIDEIQKKGNKYLTKNKELFYDSYTIRTLINILISDKGEKIVKRALKNVIYGYILLGNDMKYKKKCN